MHCGPSMPALGEAGGCFCLFIFFCWISVFCYVNRPTHNPHFFFTTHYSCARIYLLISPCLFFFCCGPMFSTLFFVNSIAKKKNTARTYLHFDILRRVMTDFFGYEVTMVMNITDVDDKIIARANEVKVVLVQPEKRGRNSAGTTGKTRLK